jgi:transcriptional regulator with XRE-family HTH domain
MTNEFGAALKRLRLKAGFGLRRFADMIEMPAPNLSAIEHGRRNPPNDSAKLCDIAVALGLEDGSEEWTAFFDAATRQGSLPADVRHMAGRKMIPVLLRTIDNRQLDDASISALIAEIEARPGEAGDGA